MEMSCSAPLLGEHNYLIALEVATKLTGSPLFPHSALQQGLNKMHLLIQIHSEETQNLSNRNLWLGDAPFTSLYLSGNCASSRFFYSILLPFLFTRVSHLHQRVKALTSFCYPSLAPSNSLICLTCSWHLLLGSHEKIAIVSHIISHSIIPNPWDISVINIRHLNTEN